VNVINDTYLGFLAFSKKKCGMDFIKSINDGRVEWVINDLGDFYDSQYSYLRKSGRHSSVVLQFFRHTIGDLD